MYLNRSLSHLGSVAERRSPSARPTHRWNTAPDRASRCARGAEVLTAEVLASLLPLRAPCWHRPG